MRDDLTIGEAAKLIGTSTYNLRYYQKEGIIKPSGKSENGYRLFSISDIVIIKCIIMLRSSGISIKDIKELLNNYTKVNYISALRKSYDKVTQEINSLTNLKNDIEKTLNSAQNLSDKYSIKTINKRILTQIKKSHYDMVYSAKEIYDFADEYGIDQKSIISNKTHFILYDEGIALCVLSDSCDDCPKTIFEKGRYICYEFVVDEDDNDDNDSEAIMQKINQLIHHIDKNNYIHESELLLIIHLDVSLVSESGFVGELQMKIK